MSFATIFKLTITYMKYSHNYTREDSLLSWYGNTTFFTQPGELWNTTNLKYVSYSETCIVAFCIVF